MSRSIKQARPACCFAGKVSGRIHGEFGPEKTYIGERREREREKVSDFGGRFPKGVITINGGSPRSTGDFNLSRRLVELVARGN